MIGSLPAGPARTGKVMHTSAYPAGGGGGGYSVDINLKGLLLYLHGIYELVHHIPTIGYGLVSKLKFPQGLVRHTEPSKRLESWRCQKDDANADDPVRTVQIKSTKQPAINFYELSKEAVVYRDCE